MRIAVAADHNGSSSKLGCCCGSASVAMRRSTPGPASPASSIIRRSSRAAASRRVAHEEAELAVIGGSGQGEVIACNTIRGVRAGLAYSRFAVEISRGNDDANVMVLGTEVLADDQALALVELWLGTPSKGRQHADRVAIISELEITEREPAPES